MDGSNQYKRTTELKTKQSKREIPLFPPLREALLHRNEREAAAAQAKAEARAKRLKKPMPPPPKKPEKQPYGMLVRSAEGKPVTVQAWRSAWESYVSEMETAYGWRAGRYFVENLLSWTRTEECPPATAMPGLLDIDIVHYGDSASWRFTAKCGGEAAFAGFAAMPQSAWLFSRDWDIMRVVRRGAGPATGWVACTLEYPFSFIHVR